MSPIHCEANTPNDHHAGLLVVFGAILIALVSARDHAGSWNDGSRLATVEALVDQHTLAIDDSIFVRVPMRASPEQPLPYPADDAGLLQTGTLDKLFISGQYYSDKSPVPALLMAGVYQLLQWGTGLTARSRPDQFCYWLTVVSSGLAYVVAVYCVYALGRTLGLTLFLRLLVTASFALATVALPYVRHVNNHILLLGVAAALMLGLARLAMETSREPARYWRLLALGTLAGLGYAIDLGTGPLLLLCLIPLVAYRCWGFKAPAVVLAAALPWLILHHAVNYAVGGTFKPANAVAEYFSWPGCPFNAQNMTGAWNHENAGAFVLYAGDLLVGKKGFLFHNLPLLLAGAGFILLVKQCRGELPELLFAGCWSAGTWLVYALTSSNHSGMCCSIRWFVPLLAPGFYILAVFLREYPSRAPQLVLLSGWGSVLGLLMWLHGPWAKHMVPGYWLLVAATWISWGVYLRRTVRYPEVPHQHVKMQPRRAQAA